MAPSPGRLAIDLMRANRAAGRVLCAFSGRSTAETALTMHTDPPHPSSQGAKDRDSSIRVPLESDPNKVSTDYNTSPEAVD